MKTGLKRVVHVGLLLLVISLVFINSSKYLEKKDGLFIDEISSFTNSNYKEYSKDLKYVNVRKVISFLSKERRDASIEIPFNYVFRENDYLKTLYVSNTSDKFDYINVILNQSLNDSHPPLYHILLHTISSITFSENYFLLGFCLNIFFLLLACVFIYKIINLFSSNRWIAILGVVFYGFSCTFINNLFYYRMYAMSACWMTMLLYLYMKYEYCHYQENKSLVLKICLIQLLSVLTHYYSLIFIGSLFAITLYRLRKQNAAYKFFLCANIFSAIMFVFVWPQFFIQFIRAFAFHNASQSYPILYRFVGFFYLVSYNLFWGKHWVFLFCFFLMGVGCVHLCKNKKYSLAELLNIHCESRWVIVWEPVLLSMFLISILSPWITDRYLYPYFPILSIGGLLTFWRLVLSLFSSNILRVIIVSLFTFHFSILNADDSKIRYLYEKTGDKLLFANESSCYSAFVLGASNNWDYKEILVNYRHPKYIVSNGIESNMFLDSTLVENKYVMYVSKSVEVQVARNLVGDHRYSVEPVDYNTDFHNVFYIVKN